MQIEGPLKATIGDAADGVGKVVVLTFEDNFKQADEQRQALAFSGYLNELRTQIAARTDESDPNRAGMMIMLQFCEQLEPHVANGDLDLNEKIILQVQREDPQGGALMNFVESLKDA